jgi:hyperosmotically inducible protein
MNKLSAIFPLVVFAVGSLAMAQDAPKPDNTKTNKGDQNPGAVTADQQKTNASDQNITKNIRQSIMADKSLSTYAHNVKIITQNGAVTLKGPVKSDSEKKSVVAKAIAVAGAGNVTDQLSVSQ